VTGAASTVGPLAEFVLSVSRADSAPMCKLTEGIGCRAAGRM